MKPLFDVATATCIETLSSVQCVLLPNSSTIELENARQLNNINIEQLQTTFAKSQFLFGSLIMARSRFISTLNTIRKEVISKEFRSIRLYARNYHRLIQFLKDNAHIEGYELSLKESPLDFAVLERSQSNIVEYVSLQINIHMLCSDICLVDSCVSHTERNEFIESAMNSVNILNGLNKTRLYRRSMETVSDTDWTFMNEVRNLFYQGMKNHSFITQFRSFYNSCSILSLNNDDILHKLKTNTEDLYSNMLFLNTNRHISLNNKLIVCASALVVLSLSCLVVGGYHFREKKMVSYLKRKRSSLEELQLQEEILLFKTLSEIVPSHLCETLIKKSKRNNNIHIRYRMKNTRICFSSETQSSLISQTDSTSTKSVRNVHTLGALAQETCKCMQNAAVPAPWVSSNEVHGNLRPEQTIEFHECITVLKLDFIQLYELVTLFSPKEFLTFVTSLIQILDDRIRLYDVFTLSQDIDSYTVVSGK